VLRLAALVALGLLLASGASAARKPPIPTIVVAPAGAVPSLPPTVTPGLGETGYVFPVYGLVSYGDTFGAARSDVSGGWHHGDDIFAPLGAPVLAVAHGIVFSVGWERLGGRRLWLRDDRGNDFYYAHLSAYSPLAVNGAIVNAGDVLGFVGDTGDAEGTPFHLHFEVHPVGLLDRGYDGAVDPTSYLRSWRRVKYLRFDAGGEWLPTVVASNAPRPGAVLLQIELNPALR
jgi:murein DD-endopeptidase MepM/ murein hydrolase activator NlpD